MSKMIDIDDYVEKQNKTKKENTPLTPTDHLEAILFQFVTLYERWSEDRQVAAKQGADVAKLVKEFSKEVTRLESLDDTLRAKIKECIHSEAKNIAIYMGKTISDAARQEIELVAKKLNKSVDEAEDTLSRYQSETSLAKWMTITLTILTSILASLSIVWFFLPTPTLPLTESDMNIYAVGKSFSELWPTLSKEKQKWFLKISDKNVHNKA